MPRANRHFIPGHFWHLTHRCHDRQFLLRFSTDRQRWTRWAVEARRQYGLRVLDYCVTCNHVHALVHDTCKDDNEVIARSMQLVAGRTAQEYNERRGRSGAFWEDRYHATAIQSGEHLLRCITYIDLNMVRAGVVTRPEEWVHSGYADVMTNRKRNRIVDYEELMKAVGASSMAELQDRLRIMVQNAGDFGGKRQAQWTEAVAVGSIDFVEDVREKLGDRTGRRSAQVAGDGSEGFVLKEPSASYEADFGAKNGSMRGENEYFWDVFP